MPVVKDKIILCHIGLADFAVESVNEVPFYRRYYEFCKLFASKVPSIDFEKCFAQPQENNAKKIIEWYYSPGSEAPMKLTEIKAVDPDLYQTCIQQRQKMIADIQAAKAKSSENEQKYLNAVLVNLEQDYIDSITYCFDDHILIGVWGMRTKTGRQIDSVITEGVLDHRAYKIAYQVEGMGRIAPFTTINRRYGHILHGDKDIPRVIPEEGHIFKEWVPEAPHGKEVKSDLVYTAVCEKPQEIPREKSDDTGGDTETPGVGGPPNTGNEKRKCQVRFNTGEHGIPLGQAWYEKEEGDTVRLEEVPSVESHEGYKFIGWDKNPDGYVVTEDVEFVAQYEEVPPEEKLYQVRFDEGDHGVLHGQTFYEKHKDETVLPSEVPDVEPEDGYKFVGWDKNPNNHVVTEDVVFVAQYKEKWWNRFWGWGSGCLNWLLTLLLLGLIGLLLWYLLTGYQHFNFCGCDCDEHELPIDTTNTRVIEPGECDEVTVSGGDLGTVRAIDMHQKSGTFTFEYDTYYAVDRITIYNGKTPQGKPIFKYEGGSKGVISKQVTFNSSDGFITVVVEGLEPGTVWDFIVNCPDQNPPSPVNPTDPVDPVVPPVQKACDAMTKAGRNTPESFVFDMGQNGGTFVFEYNTFDVHPDSIVIHDGNSRNGKVIFNYNGTTNGTRTKKVKFTQSQVYIEVYPSGDSGTSWEFIANCPE